MYGISDPTISAQSEIDPPIRPSYLLFRPHLLFRAFFVRSEAESIDLQAKLLYQNEALSNLRKDTLEMRHCLSTFWQDYNDQRFSSEKLLQLCAALFAKQNRNKFRTLIDDQVDDDPQQARSSASP
jgi:hypothetical protein